MFTVRIFLSGVDAKFDATCSSRAEAEQMQEHVESSQLDGVEAIILPPKDGGKTSGVYLKRQESAPPPQEEIYGFYSLVRQDDSWIIQCSDWEVTDFLFETQLRIRNDIVFPWSDDMDGFVVDNSQYQYAAAWVNCENQMIYNDDHPDYAEYEDEYWEPYEDEHDTGSQSYYSREHSYAFPSFQLESSGRGYLITVDDPTECDFFGEPILFLTTDTQKGPAAVWDDSKKGWIVNRRDHDAAYDFVLAYN